MSNRYSTYQKARQAILGQFPAGARIRAKGAITLWALLNGRWVPVTNVKVDADERVRAYRRAGVEYDWRVAEELAVR